MTRFKVGHTFHRWWFAVFINQWNSAGSPMIKGNDDYYDDRDGRDGIRWAPCGHIFSVYSFGTRIFWPPLDALTQLSIRLLACSIFRPFSFGRFIFLIFLLFRNRLPQFAPIDIWTRPKISKKRASNGKNYHILKNRGINTFWCINIRPSIGWAWLNPESTHVHETQIVINVTSKKRSDSILDFLLNISSRLIFLHQVGRSCYTFSQF